MARPLLLRERGKVLDIIITIERITMLSKSKFVKTLAAVGIAAAFACGNAFAAPFSAAIVPGVNQISDDNAEVVLKFDQTLNGGAGGYRAFVFGTDTIGVQDILVGIVGITSFPTGALGTSAALYNEVTGVYAVQALTAVATGATNCNAGGLLTTCTNYTFGAVTASTGGINAALTLMNSIYGTTQTAVANANATTIGAFYEDATPDYARGGVGLTLDQAFTSAHAVGDTQRIVIGQVAANGDNFGTLAPSNPAQLALLSPGAFGGSFNADATITSYNLPGFNLNADFQIAGNLYSCIQPSPFGICSDSTHTFVATPVPEPATLALLGIALAGIGFGTRKKSSV